MIEPTQTVNVFPALVWRPTLKGIPTPELWLEGQFKDHTAVKVLCWRAVWPSDIDKELDKLAVIYPFREMKNEKVSRGPRNNEPPISPHVG